MPADVNKCQQMTTMLMFFGVLHVAPQAERITQRGAKPDGQSANHAIPIWAAPTVPHTRFTKICRTRSLK